MTGISAKVKSINELDFGSLAIPNYQRPYMWDKKNVRQLLQDIYASYSRNLKDYRIGSIIVHKNGDRLDIVDGQQRSTTLYLIFNNLGKRIKFKAKYRHEISKLHIVENNEYINSWIDSNIGKGKEQFLNYIENHCSVVYIEVEDLSEAFQMFDSQNGRGKPLEAYNLLKAYHIRAIDENRASEVTDEKRMLDKRWEQAVQFESIDLIKTITNQLYRERTWNKKDMAMNFNKEKLEEFKGAQLNNKPEIPSENLLYLLAQYMGSTSTPHAKRFENENVNPFVSMNMPIINGRLFFDYVDTFVNLYKELFIKNKETNDDLKDFREFYAKYCVDYANSNRTGDSYLKELYQILLIAVFDKFGTSGVNKIYKALYALSYRIRLEKKQVTYRTVAKAPIVTGWFMLINNASKIEQLWPLEEEAAEPVKCTYIKGREDVAKGIRQYSRTHIKAAQTIKDSAGIEYRLDQEINYQN